MDVVKLLCRSGIAKCYMFVSPDFDTFPSSREGSASGRLQEHGDGDVRNFDEHTITDAVRERVAGAPDPRTRQISDALVRHLHDFVREIEPTQDEWESAIAFLTRTGHMCDGNRQEFILLSDTLCVSMLVDAINHRQPGGATETTVLGPFHVADAPRVPLGGDISPGLRGECLYVTGSVSSSDKRQLPDATIDVWHSDGDGYYDIQQLDAVGGLTMRARLSADEQGAFSFRTIMPAAYPIPNDGPVGQMLEAQGRHPFRPAHVHFLVQAPGHETLVTHIFEDGDRYLDSDVVFGVKDTLIRRFEKHGPGPTPDGRSSNEPFSCLRVDLVLSSRAQAPARVRR